MVRTSLASQPYFSALVHTCMRVRKKAPPQLRDCSYDYLGVQIDKRLVFTPATATVSKPECESASKIYTAFCTAVCSSRQLRRHFVGVAYLVVYNYNENNLLRRCI